MILAPNEMKAEPDERKAGKICLETIKLDPDWYRIGHTKARNLRPLKLSLKKTKFQKREGNWSSIDGNRRT